MSSAARRIAADFLREEMQMDGIKSSELSKIFENEPPTLTTFLRDAKYLNHMRPTLPGVDDQGYAFDLYPIQYDFVRNFEQIFHPELYIAMVEEFGDYWSPLPMKHMFVADWGKACKSPDSTVYNPTTGEWDTLRDFVAGPVASAYGEDGKVFVANGTDAFKVGEGAMYTVTTQTGKKTKVYEGHKFLGWGQEEYPSGKKVKYFSKSKAPAWKRLVDLKVGDHIATSSFVPEPTHPINMPDWEVEWTGLMIGDGSMGSSSRADAHCVLTVGDKSPITFNHVLGLIEERGLNATVRHRHGASLISPSQKVVRRGGNPLREVLFKHELMGHTAGTKFIPKEFFKLSNRQIALLISRLIDTDGWVSKSNTWEVGYGTISEQLADDVIHLLLRLGVVAEKKVKKGTYKDQPYKSFQVKIRKQRDLETLLPQLNLLDKEPRRLAAMEWLGESRGGNLHSRHGDMVWDRIASIEYEGEGEYWTTTVEGPSSYISDFGILDHNSGKDTTVRVGFVRIASLLSHMVSPQSYFNMAAFDSIQMLNVAATAQQARDAFFDPMKKLFQRNSHLSELFYGDDPAEGAHRIKLKKNIDIISGNSIAENQEGLNLIAACADEISAFKVAEEYKQTGDGRAARGAAQIVGMLRSSSSTRFPKTYKVAQISWPRFAGDAIEKAVAQGNKSIKEMGEDKSPWFVSGPHATWEVRPNTTKADFQAHYDEDPEQADAMYACKPPKSTNIFIRDEVSIDAAFETVQEEPIQVDYYWGPPPAKDIQNAPEGVVVQDGWQVKFTFSPSLKPRVGALYCLHGDMAIKGDRAGIAMSHVKSYRGEGEDERPMYKNDFTFTFESDLKVSPPREVQIRWYRQLIWELIERGFEIDTVTFDQFQCLSGDTRIPLLDGTTKTMKELEGKENFWVYSIDKDGSIVPGLAKSARWTGYRSDMVEVELDNGEIVNATKDHRFMLRDGTYTEAENLKAGDSLMPLYRRMRKVSPSSAEYEQVWHPERGKGRNRWQFTHSMVSRKMYGDLPKGWVTHHVDHSKTNNEPDNLLQMSSEDHSSLHKSLQCDFGKFWADPEWRKAHTTRISRAVSARQTGIFGRATNRYEPTYDMDAIESAHADLISKGLTPTKGAMRDSLGIAQGTLYDRVREAGYSSWKDFRNQHETISPEALKQRRHRAKKPPVNHKVVSVKQSPPVEVYDLEVAEHHNFATEAGVFVHNSFDMMQTLEMYGIGSGLLSLDRNDKVYQNFKDIILDGRLESYRPEPHIDSLVMSEIKRLRRSGRKIDHPPAFSKDAADALAGSIFNAREAGGEEDGYDLLDFDQSEDGEDEWHPDEMAMIFAGSGDGSGMDGLFGSGSPRPNPFAGTGYFK